MGERAFPIDRCGKACNCPVRFDERFVDSMARVVYARALDELLHEHQCSPALGRKFRVDVVTEDGPAVITLFEDRTQEYGFSENEVRKFVQTPD